MSDSVKFNLVGAGEKINFDGYVSNPDKTTIGRGFLVKGSKNVYIKKTGTIANRPGLKLRGSEDPTQAGVSSSYEWETSLGQTWPIRFVNGKLEVESDIVTTGTYVWYTLLDSLTNINFVFEPWWNNSQKKDILLMCDGTDSMKYWSGGIGKVASTTANTIVLSATVATQGFTTASGTVIVNGTDYAYTGSSGSTLTGVTPDPTGEADGSVVLQKPVTDADTVEADYTIDFIKVVANQLYAASLTSRKVYVSKNTDWTDFAQSSPRATGEGEEITLDETPVGIGQRDGKAHIGTRKAWYEVSFNQITIGSTLSEQTKVDRKSMTGKKGLLGHDFITYVGDDMVYLTEDQQLHIYGTFRNYNQSQFPSLSDEIEEELQNEDFTGGHIRSAGDFIYLVAPNNGRVWLHETTTGTDEYGDITYKRRWHAPFIWNLSRIAIINGVEYGYSNARPELYQMWDTLQWHDDGQNEESIPYDSIASWGYRSADRFNYIDFDKIFFEGYMTPGSDVRAGIAFEYKGERSVQELLINTSSVSAEFYIGDVGISLGDAALGDNPLGDVTSDVESDQELLPKFRAIRTVGYVHCHEYQPRVYSTEADARWEILVFGSNDIISEEYPSVLEK